MNKCYQITKEGIFTIQSIFSGRLDSFVVFEIEENGIKTSNGSSGAIYLGDFVDVKALALYESEYKKVIF